MEIKSDEVLIRFFRKFCNSWSCNSIKGKRHSLSHVKPSSLSKWVKEEMDADISESDAREFLETRGFCKDGKDSYNLMPWKEFLESYEIMNEG